MKKLCLSLLLVLTLSLGLATPALAAGYYQSLSLPVLDRYAVSFDAAHVEQKTVQTAFLGADDVQEPYELATVNPFQDVSSQDYFYTPARWAAEKGLVDGSAFHGDAGCTRANVVTYLWKLAGSPAASGSVFADVAASSELGQAVAWAAAQGIATGTSTTTFSPDKVCTRGEIVTFLYRAYGR